MNTMMICNKASMCEATCIGRREHLRDNFCHIGCDLDGICIPVQGKPDIEQLLEIERARQEYDDFKAAKVALAQSVISGIYTEFDDLADAIEQMALHIKELTVRIAELGGGE